MTAETEWARGVLADVKSKLEQRTATRADHRFGLAAALMLPDEECGNWGNYLRVEFVYVYARELSADPVEPAPREQPRDGRAQVRELFQATR